MDQIVAIAGSPSAGSRSTGVLHVACDMLAQHNIATTLIEVRDLPAEDLVWGRFDSQAIHQAHDLIGGAQGVLVATPIYKAAYSGVLKAFLDLLPSQTLADKIVLPIATGGSLGHLLAIGYALNPVLAELGATHVLGGVYIVDAETQRTGDRQITLNESAAERLNGSIQQLVVQMRLRAEHTRTART